MANRWELKQNDFEHIKDVMKQGLISADEANVRMVEARGILFSPHLPANVKKALNQAVKDKRLKHLKKDGYKPEAYYAPKLEYLIAGERNRIARETIGILGKVFAAGVE